MTRIKIDLINKVIKEIIEEGNTLEKLSKEYHLSKIEMRLINKDIKLYHDELFIHYAMYEMSYMDEVPTVNRIMSYFDVSIYLATYLLNLYLEAI